MPETKGVPAQSEKSYPALLWLNIKSRKSEFFGGLLLSIGTSCATVWLQYRNGMLEQKHFWDGIVTSAVPVLGIVVIFALVEVCRAAASLHREAQTEIAELQAARPQSDRLMVDRTSVLKLATEIAQFIAMRHTGEPLRGIRAAIVFAGPSASDLTYGAYASETAQLYSDRFLERVNNIREELALIGIIDARLDQANANPARAENMRTISDRLMEIATQLPDNPVGAVAALHEANTRLQNTSARQQEEMVRLTKQITELSAQMTSINFADVGIFSANLILERTLRNRVLVLVAELRGIYGRIKIVGDYPPEPKTPPGHRFNQSIWDAYIRETHDFVWKQRFKQHWDIYHSEFSDRVRDIINDLRSANVATETLIAFPDTVGRDGQDELRNNLSADIWDRLIPDLLSAADGLTRSPSP